MLKVRFLTERAIDLRGVTAEVVSWLGEDTHTHILEGLK